MSSAHHPQTAGQTEVANRVVEMVLQCTLHGSSEPSQWARDLSLVEFVINSSPSLSTGYAILSKLWLLPSNPVGSDSGCRDDHSGGRQSVCAVPQEDLRPGQPDVAEGPRATENPS